MNRLDRRWRRRSSPVIWTAAAVAAVVIAAVVAGTALAWRSPVAERAATSDALAGQAGTIVADVFSADASTWTADRERARALMAEPFASSVAAGLTGQPPAGVASVRWEPLTSGVVSVDEHAGTAVVVARVVVTPTAGQPETRVKSVNADFVHTDGRWLLSGVDELR
ncbi:MAG: hypothetical protein QM774_13710 [Gordonia sp. (in: high G+C Gram-positive bacteria)]|uniref:hypothetical protein n=1 Tax=Gordonia sp. (in: high G+C Gram-positive bacteria) TaxID=84139 RepID=UPI0039E4CC2C